MNRRNPAAGKTLVVGVSGASGAGLAVEFLSRIAAHGGVASVHLVVTASARRVARSEIGGSDSPSAYLDRLGLSKSSLRKITWHDEEDVSAPISSGSFPTDGMAVVPCSAGTLAAVATGTSRGLLARAADVTLKERRPLVLAFRESPYSLVHIENMKAATLAGAVIMPPSPPFYVDSPTIDRLMAAYCARLARIFGLELPGGFQWTGPARRL